MALTVSRRLVIIVVVAVVILLLAIRAAANDPEVRDWLWQATGEEDLWEGAKGVVALLLLERSTEELKLAPDELDHSLGVSPLGVNTFLQLEVESENVRRSLAAMREAGFKWARQEFPWEDIEIHGPGDFQDRRNEPYRSAWDKYDRIVDMARAHDVELLVRLDNPPDWAFADPAAAGEKGPPDDLDDFRRFVAQVAERYCGKVHYYQIWNEPNIYPEWGERDVDPAGYAELLQVAAEGARAACDSVSIVSAALAQTTEVSGRNMDDLKYLEALYEAGWQDDFDILAVQAFGLWTGPTDHRVSADRANFVRPMLARDIMVRHGDAHKPVWITEMGWDSPPEDMPAPYGRVTEERRAKYTLAAYRRIAEEWPWVGVGFLWYLRRPDWSWHERPEGYFRLLEPDWQRTPTYEVLARRAASSRPVLYRGRHQPDHWAIEYSGPWREERVPSVGNAGPQSIRVGNKDAELQFAFHGTGFRIELGPVVEKEPPHLFLVVNQQSETIRPSVGPQSVHIAKEDLDALDNTVIVRVEEGELPVSRFVIDAPEPASPLAPVRRVAATILLLTAGAILLGGWWVLRGRGVET